MKTRIAALLGAAALVVASAVLPATAASASDTQCPSSGYFCYWNNASYGGAFQKASSSIGNMGIATDNVTNLNDIVTSIWVKWGSTARVYEDVANAGRHTDFANSSKISQLGGYSDGLHVGETWSDRISSVSKL